MPTITAGTSASGDIVAPADIPSVTHTDAAHRAQLNYQTRPAMDVEANEAGFLSVAPNQLKKYLHNWSLLWSVSAASISGSYDSFTVPWWDADDGVYYALICMGNYGKTKLVSIAPATGNATIIGGEFTRPSATSSTYSNWDFKNINRFERMANGDFIFQDSYLRMIIPASGGSVTSSAAIAGNEAYYVTADGIVISDIYSNMLTYNHAQITIKTTSDERWTTCYFNAHDYMAQWSAPMASGTGYPRLASMDTLYFSGWGSNQQRPDGIYSKGDFDRWVLDYAKLFGVVT